MYEPESILVGSFTQPEPEPELEKQQIGEEEGELGTLTGGIKIITYDTGKLKIAIDWAPNNEMAITMLAKLLYAMNQGMIKEKFLEVISSGYTGRDDHYLADSNSLVEQWATLEEKNSIRPVLNASDTMRMLVYGEDKEEE